MPLLALVNAVLYTSLSEWRTGIHQKETSSADTYNEHIGLLTGIKTQNPRAYHTTMHHLYMEASGTVMVGRAATHVGNASDTLAHAGFAGMDVD